MTASAGEPRVVEPPGPVGPAQAAIASHRIGGAATIVAGRSA